jgi:hypothetical protein
LQLLLGINADKSMQLKSLSRKSMSQIRALKLQQALSKGGVTGSSRRRLDNEVENTELEPEAIAIF